MCSSFKRVHFLSIEMAKVESELRGNIEKLGSSWMETVEHKLAKRARGWDMDLSVMKHTKGNRYTNCSR